MIELTSLTSLAFLSKVLVIWAVVILAFVIVVVRHIKKITIDIAVLQQENENLRVRLEKMEKNEEAKPEVSKKMVNVPKNSSILQESSAFNVKPITVHNETAALTPEIVAAITAAITACGYPPSAIRSIKPERQRTSNWIMAARMIGMR